MYISGIDMPHEIIDALKEGNLVIFAGAGVSMGVPTHLPNFNDLVNRIAYGTGLKFGKDEPCDVFLGRLKHNKIDVNTEASKILSGLELKHNDLHELIIDLFSSDEQIKIVTTNYDQMFEQVLEEQKKNVKIYDTPALPLGNDVKGIVHIHGNVDEPEYMVLTDDDFGKAYLTDRYVSRFLVKLFETYTVLFVGYSYNDLIVQYLSRALSLSAPGKRYVLTSDEEQHWKELGITPIYYENKRFDILNESIKNLGFIAKRTLLEWQSHLPEITITPPTDLSLISEIEYCLQDDAKAKVLSQTLKGEEWLNWLDEKGIFNNIFNDNTQLEKKDYIWLTWILDQFLGSNDPAIKRLILKHNNQINKEFVKNIFDRLVFSKIDISNQSFCEYIIYFDSYLNDDFHIGRLIEKAMGRNIISVGFHLFKKLFAFKFHLEQNLFIEELQYTTHLEYRIFYIQDIWKKYYELFINNYSIDILNWGKELINDIYMNLSILDETESYKFYRFSLEEKGSRENIMYLLSDILYRSFKNIQNEDKDYTRSYIKQCIHSNSTLLRIIALKFLRETETFTVEEKKQLLLKNYSLYSYKEKEQIYLLVASIFDELRVESQTDIINKIMNDTVYEDRESDVYEKFNWLIWLRKNCKENQQIESNIQDILTKHPNFKEIKNPEKNFFTTETIWHTDTSPINKDEMKIIDEEELFELLKNYQGDKWEGPDRIGLLKEFSNSLKDDFKWTKKMIERLQHDFNLKSDIWYFILDGLSDATYSIEEKICILKMFDRENFIKELDYELSDYISKILDSKEMKENYSQYIDYLFDINEKIWLNGKRENKFNETDLITQCLNCPTGRLVLNWIKMVLLECRDSIKQRYKELFERLLEDKQDRNQIVALIIGHIGFLFAKDQEWVVAKLLPYLTADDEKVFYASWEGITYYTPTLYEELAIEMIQVFLYSVTRISQLSNLARNHFVELYSLLLIHIIENPIEEFIPKFYRYSDLNDRIKFIEKITTCLESMDDNKRICIWNSWLKDHLINRISNKPIEQDTQENESILSMTLHLGDLFPEAVSIITSGMKFNNIDYFYFYNLINSEIINNYPDDVAILLTYLFGFELDFNHINIWIPEILEKLKCESEDNILRMKEMLIQKGISIQV